MATGIGPTQAARADRLGSMCSLRCGALVEPGRERHRERAGHSQAHHSAAGHLSALLGSSAACHFIDLSSHLKHMDRRSYLDKGRVCILSAIRFRLQCGARIGLQGAPAHSGQTNESLGHRVPLTFVRSRR